MYIYDDFMWNYNAGLASRKPNHNGRQGFYREPLPPKPKKKSKKNKIEKAKQQLLKVLNNNGRQAC